MTAFPSYSTGTVSIGAGATTIVGTSTIWSGVNVRAGDDIYVSGHFVKVIDVTDTTHLVIDAWPYTAVTAGTVYKVYQTSPLRFVGGQAMADVSTLVAALNAQGYIYSVASTLSVPDPSYGNDGQYAYQSSTNTWWFKASGVWGVASPPSGAAALAATQTFTGVNTFSNILITTASIVGGNAGFTPLSNDFAGVISSGAFGGGLVLRDGTGRVGLWSTSTGSILNIRLGGTSGGFGSVTGHYTLTSTALVIPGSINSPTGVISIPSTVVSTGPTTGAFVVSGGAGFGGDLNWTGAAYSQTNPTPTAASGTFTTATAQVRTKYHGKTAIVEIIAVITNAGTGAGQMFVTVPTAARNNTAGAAVCNSNGGINMTCQIVGSNVSIIPTAGVITSGYTYFAQLTYEIA